MKGGYFQAHLLKKPWISGTPGMGRMAALQRNPPPPPTKYARIIPGSVDRPANPGPYRRDPPIPARQAAFGKPTKYRALSCPPGGPYDCR